MASGFGKPVEYMQSPFGLLFIYEDMVMVITGDYIAAYAGVGQCVGECGGKPDGFERRMDGEGYPCGDERIGKPPLIGGVLEED